MGPTKEEMEATAARAADMGSQGSRWPGMSYEQGVEAALDWVLGNSTENPMDDEDDDADEDGDDEAGGQ